MESEAQDKIYSCVYESLCNAVENGYAHDYSRRPKDYVDEIDEQSGIPLYDPEDPEHVDYAVGAVEIWRLMNR